MTDHAVTRAGFSVHQRRPVAFRDEHQIEPAANTRRRHSLLVRLSVIDISVLLVIVLLLALTPVTIHAPLKPVEAVILLVGFVVIGTANLVLLRRAVAPLGQLSKVMHSIDPMEPGRRVSVDDMPDTELAVLGLSLIHISEPTRH